MIVILGPEDISSRKKNPKLSDSDKYNALEVTVEDVYKGIHYLLELDKDDVVIYKKGHTTKIIKKPGEKL